MLLLFILQAAGCVPPQATLITAPGSPVAREGAPLNAALVPGVIRYRADGGHLRAQSRRLAYQRMAGVCHGRYQVLSESTPLRLTMPWEEVTVSFRCYSAGQPVVPAATIGR